MPPILAIAQETRPLRWIYSMRVQQGCQSHPLTDTVHQRGHFVQDGTLGCSLSCQDDLKSHPQANLTAIQHFDPLTECLRCQAGGIKNAAQLIRRMDGNNKIRPGS